MFRVPWNSGHPLQPVERVLAHGVPEVGDPTAQNLVDPADHGSYVRLADTMAANLRGYG